MLVFALCVKPDLRHTRLRAQSSVLWPTWNTSVVAEAELLYMPFLEHQLGVLEALDAEAVDVPERLAYAASEKGRMGSRVFKAPGLFRRIRMTYFDGGESLQVFNSLWYPDFAKVDAPLLGIDLLCFGAQRKLLCVVDAQPPGGRDSAKSFGVPHDASRLAAIRDAAPDLAGEVSGRWYEDNRFFSPQMLYSRFEEAGIDGVRNTLFPCFKAYLDAYVEIVENAPVNDARSATNRANQAAYDAWNADRDPAHRLFKSYFGDDFADAYVHDYLFALAHEAPPSEDR
ncbi:hypothetical protein CTAYLR_008396 [Chrysophaeum taylorii]|uniref:15,16-dihydrobiliverdin:ferredoxin oxidoreductase n=1 Tax=Chrysophaeum taylorii TaxID=2483200 RepID=A0AAD7UHG7_9STRA|nr:hypothetical protein CTAYLR_008396 [Chrysophaeum taylorii]